MKKNKLFLCAVIFLLFTDICFARSDQVFEAKAKETLNTLIDFYSNKDIDNFIALVDLNFSDSRGYNCADLAASLRQDFRSFDNIRLYITGIREQLVLNKDEIVIVAEWNRSMMISSGGQVWMSKGVTNFKFIKDKDFNIKLKEITGDLFFGLASYDNIITLPAGSTIDGQTLTVARFVQEGRFVD